MNPFEKIPFFDNTRFLQYSRGIGNFVLNTFIPVPPVLRYTLLNFIDLYYYLSAVYSLIVRDRYLLKQAAGYTVLYMRVP